VTTGSARVRRVHLPFRMPFETAAGAWTGRDSWLLRIEDAEGRVGWGEAVLDDPGDGPVLEALLDELVGNGLPPSPALVGRAGAAGRAFRAALDGARLDVLAQRPEAREAGVPEVGVNALIGAVDLGSTVAAASRAVAGGFRTLKLKAAAGESGAALAERVGAVRAAVGEAIALRVDANGTWDADDAAARVEALTPFHLQYLEQPMAPADLEGAAALRARGAVPVAADEAVDSVARAIAVLEAGAADVLVVKPARVGGPVAVAEISLVAADRGVPVVIASLWESGVGLAVALACAAALPDVPGWPAGSRDHGLATAHLLGDDLVLDPLQVDGGRIRPPFGPGSGGLGVAVDEAALDRYAADHEP
jgi:L-alanine-DL-glutamate epimerase-like enolase superfamily enzyme